MVSAEKLEAASNDADSEKRVTRLQLLEAFVEYLDLFGQGYRVSLVIKETAEDVAVLNNCDHLLDEFTRYPVENALEEALIVVQLEAEGELVLEAVPDQVVLPSCRQRIAYEFLLKPVVKLSRIFPVLAQGVDFDVAFFVAAFLRDKELVLYLRIVDEIFVRQRDEVL